MATQLSPAVRSNAPLRSESPDSPNPVKVICALIVLLSFGPILFLHAQRLWALPHYQFFPFAVAGAFVLAWSRWRDAGPIVPGDELATVAGIGACWLLLGAAEVLYSSTLGMATVL